MKYHLAQVNISKLADSIDSPALKPFVDRLEEVNGLAEVSPGFVWRLKGEENDATALRAFDDPDLIINMSVWEDYESFKDFVFKTIHVEVMRKRNDYFTKATFQNLALWWVPVGHVPTIHEAKEKLALIEKNGDSQEAFTIKNIFGPPA